MRRSTLIALGAVFLILIVSPAAFAQAVNQPQAPDAAASASGVQQEIAALRAQLDALQTRLAALEAQLPPAPPAQPEQPATPVAAGAVAPSSNVFNPDIAVIGDFLGAVGRNPISASPALEMHESEASFQAVVDPYARADFFIAFGEEGVNLEEGFVTFPALPGGLLVRVGKMRAAFGKVNTLHNHLLSWTDRPLVTSNLAGGEDGIDDAGVSVARLIPAGPLFLEATGQVFRGDSDALYHSSKPGDVSYVGHLRGYGDISESSNIDLGFSYSRGHNASPLGPAMNDSFVTQLYGVDATFRWKPLRRAIYRSLIGRSEVIWSRRDQANGLQAASGYYVSGDYQFGRRWFAGARYDRSHRAEDAGLLDSGHSLVLTYRPSEFSQVRGQYRRTRYAEARTANELLFQLQFVIGAHGAHPF
jgi:hypothetical protein